MRWVFKWINHKSNSSWKSLKCFQVSNSCLMDLGCPLLLGSSDSPIFWKGHSQAQSSFHFPGRWRRRGRSWWKKIYSSGLIAWIKCIIIRRRVRRLPGVDGAYVHKRRRYWGRFWRLRWLQTIIIIVFISCIVRYHHCRQDIERIGWQVQVVHAWGNNRELPSKTIWYRWFVRVVDCENIGLRGCNRGHWWHPCCMTFRLLGWVYYVRRFVSSRTGFFRYLFYIEHIRVGRTKWDIGWHIEWRRINRIITVEATDSNRWKLLEWSVLRVIRIHFPEAGFRLMFPRCCSASIKSRSQECSSSWWHVNKSQ